MKFAFQKYLNASTAILREGADGGAGAAIAALSGGGAPAAPAPAPTAAGTPPAAPAPAAPAAGDDAPWYSALDPAYHATITAKGWDKLSAADATKAVTESYVNLFKLVSADKEGNTLVLPKPDAPQAERDAFFAKLGRPENPDGYGITLPEGADPTLAKGATEQFHKMGLTKDQGEALGKWYMEQEVAAAANFAKQSDTEFSNWLQEKGDASTADIEAARRATRALGFGENDPKLNAFEKAFGTKGMMDLFAKIGSQMFEASAPGTSSSTPPVGVLTTDQARSRIATLQNDADFQSKLMSPNARTREEAQKTWEAAFMAAYPA